MIRCNLAVLLAQRNLKITKVSTDTGISRTTLTALANNRGVGVQFDTLDTLCRYLNVTVDQLLIFTPLNISFEIKSSSSVFTLDGECFDLTLTVERSGRSEKYSFLITTLFGYGEMCDSSGDTTDRWINAVNVFIEFSDEEQRRDQCLSVLRSVPREFIFDLESNISDSVIDNLDEESLGEHLDVQVSSPF